MEIQSVLQDLTSFRCSVDRLSFCQQCQSCKLLKKINLTKAWFLPLSDHNKKIYIFRLISLSLDLISSVSSLLSILASKDYHYATARLMPSLHNDYIQENSDHSVDLDQVANIINDQFIQWFIVSSRWTRYNYILHLLQSCNVSLLKTVKDFVDLGQAEHYIQSTDSTDIPVSLVSSNNHTRKSYNPFKPEFVSCKLTDKIEKPSRLSSAKSRLTFLDETQDKDLNNDDIKCSSRLSVGYDKIDRFRSQSTCTSRTSSRFDLISKRHSSARCTPVAYCDSFCTPPPVHVTVSSYTGMVNSHMSSFKEDLLIHVLPVHLSKKIFGYLDDLTLNVVSCVSQHWKYLAEQVVAERIWLQIAKEDVMVIQASSANTPNPYYARMVPVHIPVIDKKGKTLRNSEGKHVNVVTKDYEFEDLDMENHFEGYETITKLLDERNILCSGYNVLVLSSRKDSHRQIHYSNGHLVAVGSVDRKVTLLNVNTTECQKVISGHTGSIKCLHVDEKLGVVVSAGYDTSIRIWDILTGKCKNMLVGHKGSVVCLDVTRRYVASAAIDKVVRVWLLDTGKCLWTFKNDSVVRSLKLDDATLCTGAETGKVMLLSTETSRPKKTLLKHTSLITCIQSSEFYVFSGSSDSFAILWCKLGDIEEPLKTFRHPKEVLALDTLYCRLITACQDGKIRVWNYLNGECLRVIRGNSKNDPILKLFAGTDRLVVNTLNCVLVYNFETVQWDYTSPRYRGESANKTRRQPSAVKAQSHQYMRALKVLYHGSPLHHRTQIEQTVKNTCYDESEESETKPASSCRNVINKYNYFNCTQQINNRRGNVDDTQQNSVVRHEIRSSIAMRRFAANFRTPDVIIGRPLGGPPQRKPLYSHMSIVKKDTKTQNISIKSGSVLFQKGIHNSRVEENDTSWQNNLQEESTRVALSSIKLKPGKPSKTKIRCQSAPVHRIKSSLPIERGLTTSSLSYTELPCNKMTPKLENRPKTASKLFEKKYSLINDNLDDLKLKTFHLQIEHENQLKQKSFLK